MPFTNGTFSLYTPGNPVVTGTTIQSSWGNNTLSDVATGLSTCVLKDGTQTLTANIPFNGYRITGLGAATALTDAIQATQVQNQSTTYLTSVTGSDTIVGTATPTPSAYAAGQCFSWKQATTKTDTFVVTLNVSGLGAVSLKKNSPAGLVDPTINDLISGVTYHAQHDGTQFVLFDPSAPNLSVTTGISAAGTNQGSATGITANINVVSTVASGTGVILNGVTSIGCPVIVYNGGVNPLIVYPNSGQSINSLPANTGHVLNKNTTCCYYNVSTTQWIAVLSA